MSDQEVPQSILTPEQDHGEGWEAAVVEIFGHRSHAGFIREEERFGAKMIRIDVPKNGDADHPIWETHWYGGASIFSLTLTDAASVFAANRPYRSPSRVLLEARDYGSADESPDDFDGNDAYTN
jgi:hypothetical protein